MNLQEYATRRSDYAEFAFDPRIVIEDMACAIAEAQAALLAGRFQDLSFAISHLQTLCASLSQADNVPGSAVAERDMHLQSAARRAYRENRVLAAALRRMRGHLEALRSLLSGPSLSYQPKSVDMSSKES